MLADKSWVGIQLPHDIALHQPLQAAETPDAKETKLIAVQAIGDATEAKLNAARRIHGNYPAAPGVSGQINADVPRQLLYQSVD
jgi:hypothetical protein